MTAIRDVNQTMQAFGHPASLVADYDRWAVLLRPRQPTLGALVLVCKESARSFPGISDAAFRELRQATADIEAVLGEAFAFEKINYIMLMMVDPDVHFHVLPRYSQERSFAGLAFRDAGWPRVPELSEAVELDDPTRDALVRFLRDRWPAGRP